MSRGDEDILDDWSIEALRWFEAVDAKKINHEGYTRQEVRYIARAITLSDVSDSDEIYEVEHTYRSNYVECLITLITTSKHTYDEYTIVNSDMSIRTTAHSEYYTDYEREEGQQISEQLLGRQAKATKHAL